MNASDPYLQKQMKRKKMLKKRWTMLGLGVIILLVTVVLLAVGLSRKKTKTADSNPQADSETIRSVCNSTNYPDTCVATLSAYDGAGNASAKDLVGIAMNIALQGVNTSLQLVETFLKLEQNVTINAALQDCLDNLANAIDQINISLSHFSSFSLTTLLETLTEIQTSMSSALTFQTTCNEDGFAGITGDSSDEIGRDGEYVKQLLSNALALSNILSSLENELSQWKHAIPSRRLLSVPHDEPIPLSDVAASFPEWVSHGSRKLLQANISILPNVTVAHDGSGQFVRIQDAVNAAPNKSSSYYVIKIKAGIYNESVTIPKTVTNLMLVGDGAEKTIITGSKNVGQPGITTFNSATVVVEGNGFLARNLTIQNTAGAAMHQAVALRVSADQVVLYGCSLAGYQDTLYTHTLRQFYKECTISGTVDFIFGNSAAIFQDCTLVARVPLAGQQNTFTAQGRLDKFQNTGLSFHRCNVGGTPDLQRAIMNYTTFLGRPWKIYSRTAFMLSSLSSVVDPTGWLEWNGAPVVPGTLFYGEYNNIGAGAATSKRVNWSTVMNENQAEKFTVSSLIQGNNWIPTTQISFIGALS
ncbi:hypothetical protein O6H91_04G080100 [Diphasiastrum complanatum]|uniref:Uncharacterized protein n=2 Tax=Diphasiastrum complanatum TaxID=34168 RepID=A0ACC2B3T6_DIPCM|nr:hypothetical protein O6H91_17G004500 [Diphasiastrum complanatum]KAJ7559336.1 hypothetical protein O6H91_04G080100 [Diphasiastrum complanatum]